MYILGSLKASNRTPQRS